MHTKLLQSMYALSTVKQFANLADCAMKQKWGKNLTFRLSGYFSKKISSIVGFSGETVEE